MICVIPAAGQSLRFVERGYEEKPLLPMPDGRTMFQWVLESLPEWDHLFVIAPLFSNAVMEHISNQFDDRRHVYIPLTDPTVSPLETLSVIFEKLYDLDDTLWINYIDTFMWPNANSHFNKISLDMQACLVTFDADAHRYGRTPNGSKACSGMAYFRSSRDFVNIAELVTAGGIEYVGKGIPDMVFGYKRWHNMNVQLWKDVFDLGVPTDYELFMYGNA